MGRSFQIDALEARRLLCGLIHDEQLTAMLAAEPVVEPAPFVSTSSTNPAGLPLLSSNPDAFAKLLLDFDGRAEYGNYGSWNTDGDADTFSPTEQSWITEMWQRTAEKFSPFNIDVTTIDPGNINDRETGVVLIQSGNGAGGAAPVGGFYGGGDYAVVTGSLPYGPKIIADIIAHEAGHLMGMWHQSLYDANGVKLEEYFSGDAYRAPIMGSPYGGQRGMWWYGPSTPGPNVIQDDLGFLSNKNNAYGYRPDDHGNSFALSDRLDIDGTSLSGSGIIETTSDEDVFWFFNYGGEIDLDVNVTPWSPMLDATLTLYQMQDGDLSFSQISESASLDEHVTYELEDSSYYFLLVSSAGDYGDVGSYSISGTFSGNTTLINAPTNTKATPIAANRVDITWQDNSSNETGFRIQRTSDGGANWITRGTVGGGVTSLSDLTTSAGQTYHYRVVSFNGSFTSEATNLARAVMTPEPTNLAVTNVSYTKVTLSWTDAANEVGYLIERSTDGVNFSPFTAAAGDTTSLQVTGLAIDTQYYFRIRSTKDGYSLPSSSVAAHTQFLAAPDAPQNLRAAPYGPYSMLLDWDDLPSEDQYRIERSTTGTGGWQLIAVFPANAIHWSDYPNQPDTTFYYRVAAHNEAGWGPYSAVASAHTDILMPPSAPPTNLRVYDNYGSNFSLTWDDNANNEYDYRVEYLLDGDWTLAGFAGETDYPWYYASLIPNVTYTYRVIAINTLGDSAPSNELTFTTPPRAPSDVGAAAVGASVQVSWSDVPDESIYKILRRLAGEWEWNVVGTVGADQTSYLDNAVTPGASYEYAVSAGSGTFDSEPSDPPIPVTVLPAMVVNGTSGHDLIRIVRNAATSKTDIFVNNLATPSFSVTSSAYSKFLVNGLEGDDLVTVDFTSGDPLPAGGLNFDGGPAIGFDTLKIIGANGSDAISLASSRITREGVNMDVTSVDAFDLNDGAYSAASDLGALDLTVGANAIVTFESTQYLAALHLSSGYAVLAPSGNKLLAVNALSIADGTLDLTDNAMLIHDAGALGEWNDDAYTGATGMIASGSHGGTWDGPGIITSLSESIPEVMVSLGIASALSLGRVGGSFYGETLASGDVMIMFTPAGDMNLSGNVDGDDYFRIDRGYSHQWTGYANGDLNFDGGIDGDDYFVIDSNYSNASTLGATASVIMIEAPTALAVSRLESAYQRLIADDDLI